MPVSSLGSRGLATEQCSGRLIMLTVNAATWKCHRHRVVGQLYPTCAGGVLLFWPDKLYARPIGSFQLKDSVVSESVEHKLAFTLRPKESCQGDLLLTLLCDTADDYQRWRRAFALCPKAAASKTFANRLPSLEEEP